MSQHFLLSSQSRGIGIKDIIDMTDHQIFIMMKKFKWSNRNGKPHCDNCGCTEYYFLKKRRIWKCKACSNQYSTTSNTIFDGHKLPMKIYLMAIILFVNSAKSISALQLSRDLNVQYKTAYILLQKIRHTLLDNRDNSKLEGVIEVDACYVNHYIKPVNKKADRIDRRKHPSPSKRALLVARQRASEEERANGMTGATRTITRLAWGENHASLKPFIHKYVKKGSEIHSDTDGSYEFLHAHYDKKSVNHSIEYFGDDQACTNQAESYFSRFRRMLWGTVHKMSNKYLNFYANDIAWREDNRRVDNLKMFYEVLQLCLITNKSDLWNGYWQKRTNPRVAQEHFALRIQSDGLF